MKDVTTSSTHDTNEQAELNVSREWLQTQLGDWILPSINARHFSTHQAARTGRCAQDILEQHFGDRLHQEDRLYVVIGSDSGQLLRYIREHAPLPRGTRWLVVEPDNIMETLLQNPEISTYCDEFVQLVGFNEWESHAALLQLPAYFRIGGVVLERSLGALDGTNPEYIELTAFFDAHLTAERYRTGAQLNVAQFIEPHILSAPNFLGNIDSFKQIFPGKRAVIIAGGPSLDEQIGWLLDKRKALFIIAVSRVAARLLEAGIAPDMVATVDPHPASLTVSRHIFDFPPETVLVSGSHPYPALSNRWPHTLFCAGPLVPWPDESLNTKTSFSASGPTVTHMATLLAIYMGFKEIVFCGLDLCHAPDGRTHASGSSEADFGPLMDFSAIPVTTNGGRETSTTPDFFAGIGAMSEIARTVNKVKFINPSINAAVIEHVTHQPLSAIAIDSTRFDREALDQIRGHIGNETRQATLETLDKSISEIRNDLEKVANLAQLGLESNQAYFNLTNPARQKRHKRRMQAIDRLFKARFRRAALLAQRSATQAIMRTDLPHDFFALKPKQAENLAGQYYDAIQREARRLLPALELAHERIGTRQLELCKKTNNEEIALRYLEHGEPERIRWLEQNRPSQDTPSMIRARDAYEALVEDLLGKERARHRRNRSPRASLRQIERLFSRQKMEALKALALALKNHHEGDAARPYAHYAYGLAAELNHDLVDAASNHAEVIEKADQKHDALVLEHALLRLTHINLETKDPHSSLQTLQTAAELNPTHWRLVAQLALRQNNGETGITALTRHLEQFPGDVERIKQMVRLFVALEIPDGIPFCAQYLPYCAPAARLELEAFLKDARNAVESPGESS